MTFADERDKAFSDFVITGNKEKVIEYCKKYNVDMPKDDKMFAAGIYKAVQVCTDIPKEVKDIAFKKCIELGFNPIMYWEIENNQK